MTVSDLDTSRAATTARTRTRVLEAARVQIASHGIARLQLEEIAAASGISRPGLLRHFRSKAALVAALSVEFCAETGTKMPMVRDAWAQLLAITDYRALSVQLLNAALTDDSSVRASICHHEQLMTASGNILAASRHSPAITPRALVATWEGLLVMQSYFPSLEPGEIIRARLESRSLDAAHTPIHVTPLPLSTLVPPGFGYATGQSRRRQIVEDATLLFARNGYHRTTLRELAAEVGISSSTLLHHFGDKAGLLAEVLRRRDEQLVDRRGDEILDPRLELGELGDEARRDLKAERGLIDMYAVLSTEAAHPEHPAHAYFAYRYARTIDYFESLIVRASADVSDPHLEAVWLVALWDGLQYQLMLNPQDIDLPSELEHHIEATLGIAPGESHSRN